MKTNIIPKTLHDKMTNKRTQMCVYTNVFQTSSCLFEGSFSISHMYSGFRVIWVVILKY